MGLRSRVEAAFAKVLHGVSGIALLLGYPEYDGNAIYNSAALLRDGKVLANHRKCVLPNYAVFDEKRYFQPGKAATVVEVGGMRFSVIICEDVWEPGPRRAAAAAGAEAMLIINGSPFHMHQQRVREEVLAARARETQLPMVYLNMVGGQDELVFDGGSLVIDRHGAVAFRAPLFEEGLHVVELARKDGVVAAALGTVAPTPPLAERVYGALVLGTRDYVDKNGFPGHHSRVVRRRRLGSDARDCRRRARR